MWAHARRRIDEGKLVVLTRSAGSIVVGATVDVSSERPAMWKGEATGLRLAPNLAFIPHFHLPHVNRILHSERWRSSVGRAQWTKEDFIAELQAHESETGIRGVPLREGWFAVYDGSRRRGERWRTHEGPAEYSLPRWLCPVVQALERPFWAVCADGHQTCIRRVATSRTKLNQRECRSHRIPVSRTLLKAAHSREWPLSPWLPGCPARPSSPPPTAVGSLCDSCTGTARRCSGRLNSRGERRWRPGDRSAPLVSQPSGSLATRSSCWQRSFSRRGAPGSSGRQHVPGGSASGQVPPVGRPLGMCAGCCH